jgi:hypothetical protein
MTVTPINLDWREERLYVLNMIEDLKAEQRRQLEAASARVSVEEKAQRDIRAAHDKIRALKLKIWVMTLALSGLGTFTFELVKALLHGWKP